MSLHRAILNHHTNMKRGNMQLLPHILKDILINADLMIDNRYAYDRDNFHEDSMTLTTVIITKMMMMIATMRISMMMICENLQ